MLTIFGTMGKISTTDDEAFVSLPSGLNLKLSNGSSKIDQFLYIRYSATTTTIARSIMDDKTKLRFRTHGTANEHFIGFYVTLILE